MRPRIALIIICFLVLIASLIPLLRMVDVSISGWSIAEKIESSKLPKSTTPYFIAIFILALIGLIYGFKSRAIIQ